MDTHTKDSKQMHVGATCRECSARPWIGTPCFVAPNGTIYPDHESAEDAARSDAAVRSNERDCFDNRY